MKLCLLRKLACPSCRSDLIIREATQGSPSDIREGLLACGRCGETYPIRKSIPRFVAATNYGDSFGLQWNKFRYEQIDIRNGTDFSERRFRAETELDPAALGDKWLIECGCGNGRFLEVASRGPAQVVGVDLSNAVDAAAEILADRENVHLIQADIYHLPFRDGVFDTCYSLGVLQHTPDPKRAIAQLPRVVRPGGQIAVTIYERRRWTKLFSKYWLRPFTRRLPPRLLLVTIQAIMPVAFPITEVLFRAPVIGPYFRFAIPVANYVGLSQLSWQQRYRWAILDTFDMLAPTYDFPMTEHEVRQAFAGAGVSSIRRSPADGLNLIATTSQ